MLSAREVVQGRVLAVQYRGAVLYCCKMNRFLLEILGFLQVLKGPEIYLLIFQAPKRPELRPRC